MRDNNQFKTITIAIPKDWFVIIEKIGKFKKMSPSGVVILLINVFLKKNKLAKEISEDEIHLLEEKSKNVSFNENKTSKDEENLLQENNEEEGITEEPEEEISNDLNDDEENNDEEKVENTDEKETEENEVVETEKRALENNEIFLDSNDVEELEEEHNNSNELTLYDFICKVGKKLSSIKPTRRVEEAVKSYRSLASDMIDNEILDRFFGRNTSVMQRILNISYIYNGMRVLDSQKRQKLIDGINNQMYNAKDIIKLVNVTSKNEISQNDEELEDIETIENETGENKEEAENEENYEENVNSIKMERGSDEEENDTEKNEKENQELSSKTKKKNSNSDNGEEKNEDEIIDTVIGNLGI